MCQNQTESMQKVIKVFTSKACQFLRGPRKRFARFPRYPRSEIWLGKEGIWEVRVLLSNTPVTFQ